ncbi:polyphosphate polymerase domain-containing protein [Streptomonospora alba]|uniref:polyphosphate polymerase domain-containing protein n=1 Tax=Streptomonospora alba TaxID=183763 RepID=UPI000699B0F5|nr:polyphosphate polymerase domain-containing protein [Streptomonospora alba]
MSPGAETAAVGRLPGIGLDEAADRAELLTRQDRKHLVRRSDLLRLVDALAERRDWAVLQIGGARGFRYSSTYFDTPDLLTFRLHRQGRRRRFKIRTRSYLDTGGCSFEVKLEGAREATVKRRIDHPADRRRELTAQARSFLVPVLTEAYGMLPPAGLAPRVETAYWRRTLVRLSGAERITCDTGLVCSADGAVAKADDGWAVVECKSADGRGEADRILRALSAHPVRISKYCLAVGVLYPGMRANPWSRALRTWFSGPGGQPEPEPVPVRAAGGERGHRLPDEAPEPVLCR